MTPIVALAVEIWTINAGLHFDNFIVARSLVDAWSFADETFVIKQKAESVKEKKEKKEKAKVTRDELKKTGKVQDRITALAFEAQELAEDLWESNAPAVIGSGIAFVLLLVFLCWPTRTTRSHRSKPSTTATLPDSTSASAPVASTAAGSSETISDPTEDVTATTTSSD